MGMSIYGMTGISSLLAKSDCDGQGSRLTQAVFYCFLMLLDQRV